MVPKQSLSRREFLKMTGLGFGAYLIPARLLHKDTTQPDFHWARVRSSDLPDEIAEILTLTPPLVIDQQGYLGAYDPVDKNILHVEIAQTQWNLDHSRHYDRLSGNYPWAIVLHWFGDPPGRNRALKNYLNGFNSLRRDEDVGVEFTTSAHFLVGENSLRSSSPSQGVSVVQTQTPYSDGVPLVAAHLRGLSMEKFENNQHFYYKAFTHLGLHDPDVHSLLQDIYDGRWIHPNSRSIGIEITGSHFDQRPPGPQQIANVLGLVKAIMLRYKIPAENLLGHHEIQMNKADPGKQFMALIRFLLGVKAIVDGEVEFRRLVFGRFINWQVDSQRAIRKYFQFVREYHKMVTLPVQIYDWEILSKYWKVMKVLDSDNNPIVHVGSIFPPIAGELSINGYEYLIPENHEGVDVHYNETVRHSLRTRTTSIGLIGSGQCLYAGEIKREHYGRQVIFRHIQQDGAEIISIYSHLTELNQLEAGKTYPSRYLIGSVENQRKYYAPYLHFAIAYGTTWSSDLVGKAEIPYGAGPSYIRSRYLDPVQYLSNLTNPVDLSSRRSDV